MYLEYSIDIEQLRMATKTDILQDYLLALSRVLYEDEEATPEMEETAHELGADSGMRHLHCVIS